jgi:small-conductance mechanosensitive channel
MWNVFDGLWNWMAELVSFIPSGVLSALIVAVSIVAALGLHWLIIAMIRHGVQNKPFLRSLLRPLKGPLRLALLMLGLNVAVSAAPMDAGLAAVFSRILQVAFIGLIGWMLLVTTHLASTLYLSRYNLQAEDNLLARKHVTQVRVLRGSLDVLIVVLTVAFALMTFPPVRQYGVSLFASAGVAGIVAGLAARPMLSNLIAGIQLAITQPIRIEDAVIVENEWGWIEEITATYVVVRLWDLRRMIVPLTYFIEKPFQNWTHESSSLIGSVMLRVDFAAPVEAIRRKLEDIVKSTPLWDRQVVNLQVTDSDARTIELRALVSAQSASAAWDLRCLVREKLVEYLATEHPYALPVDRQYWLPSRDSGRIELGRIDPGKVSRLQATARS